METFSVMLGNSLPCKCKHMTVTDTAVLTEVNYIQNMPGLYSKSVKKLLNI